MKYFYKRLNALAEDYKKSEKLPLVHLSISIKGGKKKKPAKKKYKRTTEKVTYKNKQRCVYMGPRGGKYIKDGDHYKSLKRIISS